MGGAEKQSFFISYSSKDICFAREVEQILTDAGYDTIRQERDFGFKNFMSEIHEALESDARVLSLYSPDYFESDYCLTEVFAALRGDPLNKINQRLIPFRIRECQVATILSNIAYLDLVPLRQTDQPDALKDVILAAVQPGAIQQMTGPLPELWQKPQRILHPEIEAVPNFTARGEKFEQLHSLLASGQTAAITAAVSAMGGVGKSVLAKEYGWRHKEDYAGVWWIMADSRQNIITGLVELGALLKPGLDQVENKEQAAQLSLQMLGESGFEKPWLLIYDNVDRKTDLEHLTPREGAHCLITSRLSDWQGFAEKIDLEMFSPDESVEFLLKLTGSTDEAGAAELAEILGHLPLALEQAAAFCRSTGFAEYIKVYQDLLKEPPADSNYPLSVWKTFTLALERVIEGDETSNRPACPEAYKFLGILAYLAPYDIPLELFPNDYLTTAERIKVIKCLTDVSLLKSVTLADMSAGVSLHRLVQDIFRDETKQEGTAEVCMALATAFVAKNFPEAPNDVRNWPDCQKYEPHARTVLNFVPDQFNNPNLEETLPKISFLLNEFGQYLMARADYEVAEPLMVRALNIDEQSFGDNHPDVAIDLNNLAQLYQATNRLEEAEPLMLRALNIDEQSFGDNHPNVARDLNNLAGLYKDTNRLEEAEPLMVRALKIDEQSLGDSHPDVAIDLNNLAQLYQATNRLEEAEPLMLRALNIDEQSFGDNHPRVAIELNNLAQLYKATNRLEEAEPLMLRALNIDEDSLGENHPNVARGLNNLAGLYMDTNRLEEAEPLMVRALKIDQHSFGENHPKVAIRLNNLAGLYMDTNRLEEAEPLMVRALEIFEQSLPERHPNIETLRTNLFFLRLERDGKLEEFMEEFAAFEEDSEADATGQDGGTEVSDNSEMPEPDVITQPRLPGFFARLFGKG